jgi:SOS-response transcriptional repressor LexA
MDIDEIRRLNIKELERSLGPSLYKKAGMSPTQFYNLRDGAADSKTGRMRGMRKETAWRIENAAGVERGYLDVLHKQAHESQVAVQSVPLLSWVRAGEFCDAPASLTKDDAEEWLPAPLQGVGKRAFALEVRGDSMDAPTGYREGEFVYIDPDVTATHGKDVLARLDTGLTLKRYKEDEEGPYLFQLNGNKIIRPTSEWHVCGVVVFSGQRR